jgi:hypothetical protein
MRSYVIATLLLASSALFSSCTKFYECECTDHQGKVTVHVVDAKGKIQADNKCDQKGELQNCEIK